MEINKIKPAFIDQRGSIWDLLPIEDVKHVGLLISENDSVRAKHYHKNQTQYTLVLEGKIRVTTKDVTKKNSKIEIRELGEMEMLISPPYQYHAFESIGRSKCITFSTSKHSGEDYESDTFRVENIQTFSLD